MTIRVLQWNILADGLGEDGFLSTEFSPIRESNEPDAKRFDPNEFMKLVRVAKEEDKTSGMIQTMKKLKSEQKKSKKMKISDERYNDTKALVVEMKQKVSQSRLVKLKEQFKKSPELEKVDKEILDWKVRYDRLTDIVNRSDPDIITMQENDHVKQFLQDEMFSSKYTCLVDESMTYTPAIYNGEDKHKYLDRLLTGRAAFAPKTFSNAKVFRTKRDPDAIDPDDDGVVVFWRKDKFKAIELGFLKLPSDSEKSEAVVAVTLEHVGSTERFNVLSTHLPSGDDSKKEKERLNVLKNETKEWMARRICLGDNNVWEEQDYESKTFDGIVSFVRYFAQRKTIDGSHTIFALDANSRPSFPLIKQDESSDLETNVWKTMLAESSLESIWVQTNYIEPNGQAANSKHPFVVSVNKMRGPSSDQPSKIGEHQCELIDHIFTNGKKAKLVNAVNIKKGETISLAPELYKSKTEAELSLYPSTKLPSDHLPVVVDITF